MENQPAAVIQEISFDLNQLSQPLRDKNWGPILEYISDARVNIKGVERDPAYLQRIIAVKTAEVRDLQIVVELLLDTRIEAASAELSVRVAAVGRRIEGAARDGIIMDTSLVFERREGRWRPRAIRVDCPPEWAQWNSRPNALAPIHYGDAAWWERRDGASEDTL